MSIHTTKKKKKILGQTLPIHVNRLLAYSVLSFQDYQNCFMSINVSVVDQKQEPKNSLPDLVYIFQNTEVSIVVTFH